MSKRYKTAFIPFDKPMEVPDPFTGELRRATGMLIPYSLKDKDFCKVYYKTLSKLADLPKSAQKVLDHFLIHMDFENKVVVPSLKELATELGLSYSTIRKSLMFLKKQGYIRMLGNGLYMVNPAIACKVDMETAQDLYVRFVPEEEYEEFIAKVSSSFKQNDSKRKKE